MGSYAEYNCHTLISESTYHYEREVKMSITFTDVYKYKGVLTSYLRGKLPPADAEDVLQETFLLAATSLDKFDPIKGAVYTWLLTILKGRLRIAYSKFHRRNELQCTVDLAYSVTPYDEYVLAESISLLTEDMFIECSNSTERMRRLRARRKYVREVLA